MTASASAQTAPRPHPLLPGASPATIRDWLLPEDRDRFVAEYRSALDDARQTLQLAAVQGVVEQWRRIAMAQSDPAGFRKAVRAAAALMTGDGSPEDEPFEVTRAKAGM